MDDELVLEYLEFILLSITPNPMRPYLSELTKHCSYLMTLREMLGQEKTRKHFCLCLRYAWSARGREKSKRMDE